MASAADRPLVLRWGIISTGMISTVFGKDLLVDPKTRGIHDIVHKIAAVGSRTAEKAEEFIRDVAGGDQSIKAYGSYEEVYADENVDVVYIGTPHTYHYTNSLDAIKAKKHVLCEKPVTINSAELHGLLAAAKEHNVFFMEAMWTRFQPLAIEVKKIIDGGKLGAPVMLNADLSLDFDIDNLPKSHRILDPNLGGGGLLDLGPYPLFWAILALYEHPRNEFAGPSRVTGAMIKTPLTNVDSSTSFTLNFTPHRPNGLSAQAVLSCSITCGPINPGVIIRFEHGLIEISEPIYRPLSFIVRYHDTTKGSDKGTVVREERREFKYEGHGMAFEADEVARCISLGEKESKLWGHNKSLLEISVFDEVRRMGGYEFPKGVEKVVRD